MSANLHPPILFCRGVLINQPPNINLFVAQMLENDLEKRCLREMQQETGKIILYSDVRNRTVWDRLII